MLYDVQCAHWRSESSFLMRLYLEDIHKYNCRLNEISLTRGRDSCIVEGEGTMVMLLAVAVSGYSDLLVIAAIDAA
jgi:hypothetical protein